MLIGYHKRRIQDVETSKSEQDQRFRQMRTEWDTERAQWETRLEEMRTKVLELETDKNEVII